MNRIFWVDLPGPGRLAIVARPRGGELLEDDIGAWCAEGFSTIVSLIEKAEMDELDLAAFPERCRSREIDFHHLPIPDRGVPPSLRARPKSPGRLRKNSRRAGASAFTAVPGSAGPDFSPRPS